MRHATRGYCLIESTAATVAAACASVRQRLAATVAAAWWCRHSHDGAAVLDTPSSRNPFKNVSKHTTKRSATAVAVIGPARKNPCMSREILLMKRNSFLYIFKFVQVFPPVSSIIRDALHNRFSGKEESQKEAKYNLKATVEDSLPLQVDDMIEEMDLKWQVAMISMRIKKFYKKTGRKLQFDAKEPVGFDKTKVECYLKLLVN
ncbi:hypothetical protein Tco_0655328 [Tanacetum coccineum]|uniref:Uncharacterized protein n=1 Tax=Tanacetum coccineum TaxID=301880 RepID=A0ABQ4X5Q6_9ASTR